MKIIREAVGLFRDILVGTIGVLLFVGFVALVLWYASP